MERGLVSLFGGVVSVLNRAGGVARALGVPVLRLSVDALEDAARAKEGGGDFGDPSYRDGLVALVDSIERDARLHTLGRLHMRTLITQALATRLRLVKLRRLRPDLDAPPAVAPLIVCGLPRSGTTYLHRLLSELDGAQPLPLWQLMEPIAGAGVDRRLKDAHARMARLAALSPTIDAQHYIRADLPDECAHLFKATFLCSLYWQAPAAGYLEWYLRAPVAPAYRDYRAMLAALAQPGRRLTLKDPFHARHLEELFAVIPDAMVVITHRDPLEVVPSFHKLTRTMQQVLTDELDVGRMVDLNTRWLRDVVDRMMGARGKVPAGRVLDVAYGDLVADPVATVERVRAHFGLPRGEAEISRVRRFVDENPQRKHGHNPYAASDFGQTPEQLAAIFGEYRAAHIAG
jgi:hypothetical protein